MVRTRSCTPDSMWLAATMAVDPPTDPAVCTRNSGLPTAPSASARYALGHHHALEEVGGLADDDGVDVVHRHVGVGERPVDGLAEQAGQRHVAPDRGVLGLADADDGDSFLAVC